MADILHAPQWHIRSLYFQRSCSYPQRLSNQINRHLYLHPVTVSIFQLLANALGPRDRQYKRHHHHTVSQLVHTQPNRSGADRLPHHLQPIRGTNTHPGTHRPEQQPHHLQLPRLPRLHQQRHNQLLQHTKSHTSTQNVLFHRHHRQ